MGLLQAAPIYAAVRCVAAVSGVAALMVTSDAGLAQQVAPPDPAPRVIYEIPSRASARPVLRAVEAHLDEHAGKLTVAVVAHGSGVDAMLKGAADADGVSYAPALHRLALRGVDFSVCDVSLKLRGIARGRVTPEGRIVPRGSGEIARLISNGYQPLN